MYPPSSGIYFRCVPLFTAALPEWRYTTCPQTGSPNPELGYQASLVESGLLPLHVRRMQSFDKLFEQILDNPNHKLNNFILKADTPSSYNYI